MGSLMKNRVQRQCKFYVGGDWRRTKRDATNIIFIYKPSVWSYLDYLIGKAEQNAKFGNKTQGWLWHLGLLTWKNGKWGKRSTGL